MTPVPDSAEFASPSVSVVIACHSERRWHSILAAVASALDQRPAPTDVIVAVDHNPGLAARLRRELPQLSVVENHTDHRGASATRNIGVSAVTTPLAAFLDDDETATANWLAALIEPFSNALVVGTGGRYEPCWQDGRPTWFPDEFGWVVGASYTGLPTSTARVRNVWSGNMAVRTEHFRAVGGFRVGFGKVAGRSRPEDTDLCIRLAAAARGGHWVYVPHAVILHEVPDDRSTMRFFLARCYAEGRGKIEMKRGLDGRPPLDSERDYLRKTLPQGVVQHVRTGPRGVMRAGVIVAGVVAAGSGAVTATAASRRAPRTTVAEPAPVMVSP